MPRKYVNRMKIRRKQGLVFWFFNILVFALVVLVIGAGAYYYMFYNHGTDSTAVDLQINAPDTVSAGQDFSYTINYNNQEYVSLKKVNIKADYPTNFIFESADPAPDVNTDTWNLSQINAKTSGKITIKGKIIDKVGASSIVLAQMLYTPENFSMAAHTQFHREAARIVREIYEGHKIGLEAIEMDSPFGRLTTKIVGILSSTANKP